MHSKGNQKGWQRVRPAAGGGVITSPRLANRDWAKNTSGAGVHLELQVKLHMALEKSLRNRISNKSYQIWQYYLACGWRNRSRVKK